MSRKKLPPLTVEAVREKLAMRDPDDPTRSEAWTELPISVLCEDSPADAPQIIERVILADAPGVFADALRTDQKLLRAVTEVLGKKGRKWRKWKNLRDGLAMFEEAIWLQRDTEPYQPRKTGQGRRTNVYALERDRETFSELRALQDALSSGQSAPPSYQEAEFKMQAAEIAKREEALDGMKDNSSAAEYRRAQTEFKTESLKRAAIVWLVAAGLPHAAEDAERLIARVKKSTQAFRKQVEPLRPK